MEFSEKESLRKSLLETKSALVARGLDEALHLHLNLVMDIYQKRPLFYKNVLKLDRFIVVLTLLSFSFKYESVPLSKIKSFCYRRGYLSRNSLDAHFSLLFVSGYMRVMKFVEDSRQRIYKPSDNALDEAAGMVNSYILPLKLIDAINGDFLNEMGSRKMLKVFFRGFSKLLAYDLMIDKLLPQAKWMMNRDGGYIPMLALYIDSMREGTIETGCSKVSSYVELSSRIGVSKTHIMRMVKEGEFRGYFKCQKNMVEILPSFFDLMRETLATHFSIVHRSFELGLKVKDP